MPGNSSCTPLLEDVFADEVDVFWILLVLEAFEFARARLRASSKDNSFVGVGSARDLGLNFFGEPKRIKCIHVFYYFGNITICR